jgi:tetratricopeptide (TPR) repeat protein
MQRCFAHVAQFTLATILALPLAPRAQTLALAQAAPHLTVPQSTPTSAAAAEIELSPETRGDLAMAHEQYLQAIDFYTQVSDKNAVTWNKLGMAYHHLFAFDEARRDYEHALHLRSNYPEAMNNLGAIYYAKRNYKKAIHYYTKAIDFNPKSAPIYSNLGTAWFARGKAALGIEAYRTAFSLDPNVFASRSALLIGEALPPHERALQDFCIAKLFAASGNNGEAIEFLRKALNEGLSDRRMILKDQTLASVRATPEFAQLMNEEKIH